MQYPSDIERLWASVRQDEAPGVALEQLFHIFYDDLFAYACKMLGEKAGAKDAIQNTFADLWYYRRQLQPDVSVRPYLFRAVRNHCARLLQKLRPTLQPETLAGLLFFEPDELVLEEAGAEQKLALTRALNTLSPRQREILFLKFYDNLDYAEIAEVLEINYQSVLNHASQAIRRLRAAPELKF